MSTNATPAQSTRLFSLGKVAIVAVLAAVANMIVFWIGTASGASMTINSPGYSTITLAMSALASFFPIFIAALVVWFIARKHPKFCRIAQWLGVAVAVLSMVSPFFLANDTATGFVLAAMHLVVAIGWYFAVAARKNA